MTMESARCYDAYMPRSSSTCVRAQSPSEVFRNINITSEDKWHGEYSE